MESTDKSKNEYQNSPILPKVLYYISYIFGLNIDSQKKSKVKENAIWIYNKIVTAFFVITILARILPLLLVKDYPKSKQKTVAATFVANCILLLLFQVLRRINDKISKTFDNISRLSRSLQTPNSYRFSNVASAVTIAIYVLSIILKLYPYNEERYRFLFSRFNFLNVPFQNTNTVLWQVCLHLIGHHACLFLFPAFFVAIYVILCHQIQIILSFHLKRNMASLVLNEANVIRCLNYYNAINDVLVKFEASMSLPIFMAFSHSVFSLLLGLLQVMIRGDSVMTLYFLTVHSILITSVCFAAVRVSEADRAAKEANFDVLEVILKKGERLNMDEIVRFWRSNKSPPFTLSAWGFFSFTKGNYLGIVNCLITYTLLVSNL